MTSVPESRIRAANARAARADGRFVLYWMMACRRTGWNFALQRAVEWARRLHQPLIILEALRCGYRWASDRLHRFILDGMADNARRLQGRNVFYYPYVEPTPDAGKGLLAALGQRACVVVADDFPAFMLPRMTAAAAQQLPVLLEAVDSNGLLPLQATDLVFSTAYAFRRFLQKNLPPHLDELAEPDPLARLKSAAPAKLPKEITKRWPPAPATLLNGEPAALANLPIDHAVRPVATRGGATAAQVVLKRFLKERLPRYAEERNQPEQDAASGLSPYLHFGHVAAQQVFAALMKHEQWTAKRLGDATNGRKEGWWGCSAASEAFLDELITWRELGYNMCRLRENYDQYESLPAWARRTLERHARDPREYVYSLEEFERARTHDPLWNAAQTQLLREGRMHNYLRMLWGKKILEWSRTPREALETMIELNNKYALDGRNPNSYSGIFWVLGRYDRPWAPERPVYGVVRYMSSANTARKLRVREYVRRYAPAE